MSRRPPLRVAATAVAALAVAGFLFVEMLLVGSALGTPAETIPAYAAAVAYFALVATARRRERTSLA